MLRLLFWGLLMVGIYYAVSSWRRRSAAARRVKEGKGRDIVEAEFREIEER